MKIYRNGYVSNYNRYFFFLHGRCIELHDIIKGKFHIFFSHYRRRDVIKEPENFPVVGEISEIEIVEFILKKINEKEV